MDDKLFSGEEITMASAGMTGNFSLDFFSGKIAHSEYDPTRLRPKRGVSFGAPKAFRSVPWLRGCFRSATQSQSGTVPLPQLWTKGPG
jgi:hypothetical protein